jgi:hypothetical protein
MEANDDDRVDDSEFDKSVDAEDVDDVDGADDSPGLDEQQRENRNYPMALLPRERI